MYYVIEISTTDKVNKSIYSYDTQMEAIGTFHQKIGGAMKNENYIEELCQVIDDVGTVLATDHFKREIPVVEEIEEGDENGIED